LPVDEAVRAIIHERRSERDLRAHMTRAGVLSLGQDALRWLDGSTSLAEVLRVCETA
jgi:type II secretory ATPase GspE/PulE/Tfp pilus assembly ATPase PilB-like protein